MKLLQEWIEKDGEIIDDHILKVDAFLNHQIATQLIQEIGHEFYNYFKKYKIDKIVTVESSGIAPALMCAILFNVDLVFMKKSIPSTMKSPLTSNVFSYTKNKSYKLCMEKEMIHENEHILFIDDFLANGEAFKGAENIIKQAGGVIVGVGIVIEKSFQKGHDYILDSGYDLYSLVSIKSIEKGHIIFE
ncbi:MAG: xanthine phosphoribosyltransferase [Traorella sp.]